MTHNEVMFNQEREDVSASNWMEDQILCHIFLFLVCVCVCMLSHAQLFVTPWTVAIQVSLSMEFSRQVYWSGLPLLQGAFLT